MTANSVLLQRDEHRGEYVALKSFNDNTVIANGIAPKDVMAEAVSKGYSDAVIIYVPENDMTYVY